MLALVSSVAPAGHPGGQRPEGQQHALAVVVLRVLGRREGDRLRRLPALKVTVAGTPDEGHRNPNSPIYHDAGCYLFDSCLTCPLPSGKAASNPSGLKRSRLLQMHHPLVAPHNGRGIGDR